MNDETADHIRACSQSTQNCRPKTAAQRQWAYISASTSQCSTQYTVQLIADAWVWFAAVAATTTANDSIVASAPSAEYRLFRSDANIRLDRNE